MRGHPVDKPTSPQTIACLHTDVGAYTPNYIGIGTIRQAGPRFSERNKERLAVEIDPGQHLLRLTLEWTPECILRAYAERATDWKGVETDWPEYRFNSFLSKSHPSQH